MAGKSHAALGLALAGGLGLWTGDALSQQQTANVPQAEEAVTRDPPRLPMVPKQLWQKDVARLRPESDIPVNVDDYTLRVDTQDPNTQAQVADGIAVVAIDDDGRSPVIIGKLLATAEFPWPKTFRRFMGRLYYPVPPSLVEFADSFRNSPGAMARIEKGVVTPWVAGTFLRVKADVPAAR